MYISGCPGVWLRMSFLPWGDGPFEAGPHVGWTCSQSSWASTCFQSLVDQSESYSFCSDHLNLEISLCKCTLLMVRSTRSGPESWSWGSAPASFGMWLRGSFPNSLPSLSSGFSLFLSCLPLFFPLSLQSYCKAIKTMLQEMLRTFINGLSKVFKDLLQLRVKTREGLSFLQLFLTQESLRCFHLKIRNKVFMMIYHLLLFPLNFYSPFMINLPK